MPDQTMSTALPSKSYQTWFITGVTGLIGREILRRLLRDSHHKIIVLVRPNAVSDAQTRVNTLLSLLGLSDMAERVDVYTGNLCKNHLGLSENEWNTIAKRVTHIVHLGALTHFDISLDDARQTNIGGTRQILQLAHASHNAGGLRRLVHTSSAYASGSLNGELNANHINISGDFLNHYFQSKCESEALIREHLAWLPITIVKPSIVVGDSRTGEVTGFNSIYWAIKTYLEDTDLYCTDAKTLLDIVPVDYVADATLNVAENYGAEGTSLYLAGGQRTSISLGQFEKLCCAHLGTEKPWVSKPTRASLLKFLTRGSAVSRTEKNRAADTKVFLPYFSENPSFQVKDTEDVLANSDIRVPTLKGYFHNILDYCLEQGWGQDSPLLQNPRRKESKTRQDSITQRSTA